jgi:hypothetical protein
MVGTWGAIPFGQGSGIFDRKEIVEMPKNEIGIEGKMVFDCL